MRRPRDYPTILHLRAQVKDRAELINTTSDQPINTLRSTSPIVPVRERGREGEREGGRREGREGGREGEVASRKRFYIKFIISRNAVQKG